MSHVTRSAEQSRSQLAERKVTTDKTSVTVCTVGGDAGYYMNSLEDAL